MTVERFPKMVCVCGHSKSNHHEKMIDGVRIREICEQFGCNCNLFVKK
jgi:hypothetical protein